MKISLNPIRGWLLGRQLGQFIKSISKYLKGDLKVDESINLKSDKSINLNAQRQIDSGIRGDISWQNSQDIGTSIETNKNINKYLDVLKKLEIPYERKRV